MGFLTILFFIILGVYVYRLFAGSTHGVNRGRRETREQGDVTVYKTPQTPPKRVNDNVGEYVDYKEVKGEDK